MTENIQSSKSTHLRFYPYVAVAIVGLAIAIRLLGLNKGIWIDEYYSLKIIFSKDMFATFGMYDDQPPLYLILLRLWSTLGKNEETLRILSVVLGTGTVVVMMNWLRSYSDLASIISGLVCATLPILLRYSQELRSYPLFLFSTVLSFFFASRIITKDTKLSEYVGLACSLSIVVASHLVGMAMVASVFVFLVAGLRDLRRIFAPKFIFAFAIPSLVFGYILFVWTPWIPNQSNWWVPAFSSGGAISTANYVFGVLSFSALADSIQQNNPTLASIFGYVTSFAFIIFCIGLTLWGNWRRSWSLLAAAMFYWVQIITYSVFVTPIFIYRTALPALIPFIGFVGLQVATISAKRIQWITIAALVFVSSVFAIRWITSDAYLPYEPWRQVAQLLESKRQPNNLVVFYPSYIDGPIRYYASELQSEDVILVGLGSDTNAGIAEIGERIVSLKEKGIQPVLFLIVRDDANVAKDLAAYNNLLNNLESGLGSPSFSQTLGILAISEYESKSN